jgi:hypothetical protein
MPGANNKKHQNQNKSQNQRPPFSDKETLKESVSDAVEKYNDEVIEIGATEKVIAEALAPGIIEIKSETKAEDEKESLIIKLSGVYSFEGKIIKSLDLRKIETLNTLDLEAIEKLYFSGGNFAPISEMSLPYTKMVVAQSCGYPVELLNHLKANDAVKIKNAVSGFLLS